MKPGQSGIVKTIKSPDSIRRRLLDIGLIENTEIECLFSSIMKDPIAYLIRGAVIALRLEDSQKIEVEI